ncbi:hypothetical protein EON67_06155 [archaeon]|nr:MAG: hypothetical protein EON67_06155 [archaeon]
MFANRRGRRQGDITVALLILFELYRAMERQGIFLPVTAALVGAQTVRATPPSLQRTRALHQLLLCGE